MRCREIIRRFKDFFINKKYHLIDAFPLLPNRDIDKLNGFYEYAKTYRTSIGTVSSMKMLSEGKDPFVVIQNCYRHQDVVNNRVGDGRHLGFFRMAGIVSRLKNRRNIISDSYDFLTSLNIDRDRIWATYFGGAELQAKIEVNLPDKTITKELSDAFFPEDIEMKKDFLSLGLSESKIVPLENDINFSGLIASDMYGGARGHLYYDLTEKPCSNNCYPEHDEKCVRFLEICVFVQEYLEKKEENKVWNFIPLKDSLICPIIVTGIGVERIGMILQHLDKIENLDIFQTPLGNISLNVPGIMKDTVLLHLLQSALILVSNGAIPRNKTNRGRQLKELMEMILEKQTQLNISEDRYKFIYHCLEEISDYFKGEYPQLPFNIERTIEYISKRQGLYVY